MQVDVPRERAYPNPRLSSPRFCTDRGGQRRSNANRLFWPHIQPVISEDDVLAAASPLYLPMHQQDVIHSLIVFASSATTCMNVNCVWSAIAVVTPHDTLCVRWHNEVCSSFSLVRTLTDTHMPTVHRTANITTTPQTTPTLARSRQNSTTSSTASLRLRRCSAADPRLASSCG